MASPSRPAVSVVLLTERPDLTGPAQSLIEEFLLLPDSWVLEVATEGSLPEFLVQELALLPGDPAPPSGAVAVGLVDGEPVGTAQIRRMDMGTCELKRVYVRAGRRRNGVGRALVEKLVEVAGRLGYSSVYLDTTLSRPGSVAFYEQLGFDRTDSRHDWGPECISFVRRV